MLNVPDTRGNQLIETEAQLEARNKRMFIVDEEDDPFDINQFAVEFELVKQDNYNFEREEHKMKSYFIEDEID